MVLENRYYWRQSPIFIELQSRTGLGVAPLRSGATPFVAHETRHSSLSHPRCAAQIFANSDFAILTMGLSPSGHGCPSCPASRCLIKASIRLYPSQLNSASSRKDKSLYLRTRLASANAAMASALSLLSSSHIVSPLSRILIMRIHTVRRNRTPVLFPAFRVSFTRRLRYMMWNARNLVCRAQDREPMHPPRLATPLSRLVRWRTM